MTRQCNSCEHEHEPGHCPNAIAGGNCRCTGCIPSEDDFYTHWEPRRSALKKAIDKVRKEDEARRQ